MDVREQTQETSIGPRDSSVQTTTSPQDSVAVGVDAKDDGDNGNEGNDSEAEGNAEDQEGDRHVKKDERGRGEGPFGQEAATRTQLAELRVFVLEVAVEAHRTIQKDWEEGVEFGRRDSESGLCSVCGCDPAHHIGPVCPVRQYPASKSVPPTQASSHSVTVFRHSRRPSSESSTPRLR